ncbi:3-hydroxyacyl-CoA dehydrogenase NAD-binding domain-containing protein [Paraburkholderia oxyphila]|uniref:3-hydroxyacyl-CoA dehydrogenase NAD-binding domain-containing protein n=1 Tax=Paraburkholderia oxyphila TaxID=614212 RepID=UPI000693A054|nr:3-hydroxyacyl-CoA dehydrogenase NAD-binding domain-containing protein [Paraburkholderia oxyphila]
MATRAVNVAVVGTGVIGAGWATHFLAHGFAVTATDPGQGAESRLRNWIDDSWPVVERLGLADGASRDKLTFTTDVGLAVRNADFIQESGPERLDVKRALIMSIESAARDLGMYPETDDYIESIASGVDAELQSYDFPEMLRQRDQLLIQLLEAKRNLSQIPKPDGT